MSSNIPYLAWRGENIRLVKCSDDLSPGEISVLRSLGDQRGDFFIFSDVDFDFLLEEWGGGTRDPQAIGSSSGFFLAGDKICVRETWTSAGAGLARIKLAVNVDTTHISGNDNLRRFFEILQRTSLLQHQFLAGWMTMSDPVVTELPLGGDGPNSEGNPYGSGVLNQFWADGVHKYARGNDGVLQAKVTGTLPVGGDFAGVFPTATLTLPTDWPLMAQKLATDANVNNTNPSNRWDIHDQSDLGSFTTEGHPLAPPNACDPVKPVGKPINVTLTTPILDAVDNCGGGYAFSRVFDADGPGGLAPVWLGLTGGNTRGPFDPQRPQETFLGDGQLTADDAPMPAARIDFSIKENSNHNTDIGGVGSFAKTNKNDLYSADRPLNANAGSGSDDEHNLYAPFYRAYVPATAAPDAEASGTDGLPGNNFSGYLVGDRQGGEGDRQDDNRLYDYWDIAHEFTARTLNAYDTKCLWRENDSRAEFRQTPEGPQKVAIYTDEHGIGDVNFRPGSGFWFNALLAANPNIGDNLNGGCDLKYLADNILGHADITAASYYPNQPVSGNPVGTAAIRKTVKSLFAKYLAVFPKGNSPELRNARIVVAHAQDIDGSPFAYETVCFSNTSASGSISAFVPTNNNNLARQVGPYKLLGTERVNDPTNSQDSDRVCVRTNEYGNAAVEVLESQRAEINIIGDFTDERILRDVHIPFAETTPTTNDPGIPPRAAGAVDPTPGPAPVTANGNTSPSQATLAALAEGNVKVSSSRKLKAARVSVRFARVVNSAKGARYLSLRLKGTKSTAAVKIQLMGYNGKVVKTLRRTVKVGQTVKLKDVKLGANVRNVRVSVVNG